MGSRGVVLMRGGFFRGKIKHENVGIVCVCSAERGGGDSISDWTTTNSGHCATDFSKKVS